MVAKAKMNDKQCTKCGGTYPATRAYFYKAPSCNDGLRGECMTCSKRIHRLWHKQNRKQELEKKKEYMAGHRVEKAAYDKQRRNTPRGRLYEVYYNLSQRTTNPKCKDYHNYGGRGIGNKFKNFTDFYNYVVDELGYDDIKKLKGLQIDRIDNDGHYEPGNIRFVTCSENCKNRRPRKKKSA